MQPGESFWDGVGQGIGQSPWWALLGAVLVIGTLFIVAKYINPSRERVKMRELDIREREAENDAARIEANRALAEQTRGLKESIDNQNVHMAEQTARLEESALRSRDMGGTVNRIDKTTSHTDDLVVDIHRSIKRIYEGTD